MGLSANVLWHQTKEEYFYKILEESKIKYAYSLERVIAPEGGKEIAFPMISMCNLPLSEFTGYISKYGGYSLGFKEQWGKENGFSSVWYCGDTSVIRKSLVNDLRKKDKTGDINSLLIKIFSYIKLTEDELLKKNYSKYRFADERELRIVPTLEELKNSGFKSLLVQEEYKKYKREKGNPTIDLSISFTMSDLRYLVVPTEKDVRNINEFFFNKGSMPMIPVLTHQQILEDFIGQDHNKRISVVDTLTEDELIQAARKHFEVNGRDLLKQLNELWGD